MVQPGVVSLKFCRGCVDLAKMGVKSAYWCDYIGHNGKARSLICPAGELCTVKSTRRRVAPAGPGAVRLLKWDTGKAMKLYRLGQTDLEIATAIGVHQQTVYLWRKRNDIKSNGKPGRKRRTGG